MLRAASTAGARRLNPASNVLLRSRLAAPSVGLDGESNKEKESHNYNGSSASSILVRQIHNASIHSTMRQTSFGGLTGSFLQSSQSIYTTTTTTTKRFNSSSTGGSSNISPDVPIEKMDTFMDQLFHEAQTEAKTGGDEWFLDAAVNANTWEPTWYNFADQAVNAVQTLHEVTGWHYAGSIVASTCAIRLLVLPIAIRSQRAASRMAHLQPELAIIKKRYEALGTPTQAEQRAFGEQMKSLFAKYEVGPFQAMAAPLLQIPLFIGMFFGMKKMPDIFASEMSTGGLAWFTDLTVPDPTYALPIICGISFLATIEGGKDQMMDANPAMGATLVNAFRAMAFVMVPVMTTFPAAMLCYWVPNNILTLAQSVLLRNDFVKKQLGIWDRPKPVPGMTPDVGMQKTMENLVKQVKGEPTTEKEIMKRHNEGVETKKKMSQLSRATRSRRRSVSNK